MEKNSKQFVFNLLAQMFVFCANMIISIFLTPYIVEKLGTEAYGFVGLINNFVSYVSIITVALNALAGRFITLAYHKGEKEKVNEYFASVFFANTILAMIVFGCSLILSLNIESLVKIPSHLTDDVKITVIIAFANTSLSLIGVVLGVAAFIKNKLFLNSISQMASSLARVTILILAFTFLKPHIWYYSIAAFCAALITLFLQFSFTRRLLPELKIKTKFFNFARISEIIKSGIWLSLESLNKMLQTGLDLLVTNLFVDAVAMGLFSVAKQIPVVLAQIPQQISTIFYPELVRLYAEDKKEALVEKFHFTIKFLSFMMMVPLIGFIAFGGEFYQLWLPQRSLNEINMIQMLSWLTVLPLLVNAYVECLYYANTLTNKIKGSVIITLIFSVVSIAAKILLLSFSDINPLVAIAGSSAVLMVVRHVIVTPYYCAYVLQLPRTTFYGPLIKSVIISGGVYLLYNLIDCTFEITSWTSFFVVCGISGIIGYLCVFLVLFTKKEKNEVVNIVLKKITKKR